MNNKETMSCFGITIGLVILILGIIFIEPLIILKGWNMIAVAHFGAPILTYWEVFWGAFAINCLIPHSTYTPRKN